MYKTGIRRVLPSQNRYAHMYAWQGNNQTDQLRQIRGQSVMTTTSMLSQLTARSKLGGLGGNLGESK